LRADLFYPIGMVSSAFAPAGRARHLMEIEH